jgi:hypothetical protein
MTLTIHLSPAEEARLETAARQKGIAVAELARQLLTEQLPKAGDMPVMGATPRVSPEVIIRTLDELAELNRSLPLLPPEAFEREHIYEDQLPDGLAD